MFKVISIKVFVIGIYIGGFIWGYRFIGFWVFFICVYINNFIWFYRFDCERFVYVNYLLDCCFIFFNIVFCLGFVKVKIVIIDLGNV